MTIIQFNNVCSVPNEDEFDFKAFLFPTSTSIPDPVINLFDFTSLYFWPIIMTVLGLVVCKTIIKFDTGSIT